MHSIRYIARKTMAAPFSAAARTSPQTDEKLKLHTRACALDPNYKHRLATYIVYDTSPYIGNISCLFVLIIK